MQLEDTLEVLEQAIGGVLVEGLTHEQVERLVRAQRRLDFVCNRALAHLDDVSAARCLGNSVSHVRAARARERRLKTSPRLAQAVAEGELSTFQSAVLVDNPESIDELLPIAAGKTPNELKTEAAQIRRSSGEIESERYRHLRNKRSLRFWVDGDGLVNILAKLPPDDAAPLLAQLRGLETSLPHEAGATHDAHRADAFVEMATATGSPKAGRSTVHVHVDLESLRRGWAEGDGFCEVAGLGRIPVGKARNIFDEATLHLLVSSKNELVWSGGLDKTLPRRIRDAVAAHNRHRCQRCGAPGEEVDHKVARINGGNHDPGNLELLCKPCHDSKTVKDAPWSTRYYRGQWPRAG